MTTSTTDQQNIFLSGSLATLFAKTAAPIITVMTLNGLFTLVDAYFLGAYVSAEALTAVTLMFPIYMLLVALSTLVSSGFSSVFARLLGAGETTEAGRVFVQAIMLSLIVCAILVGLFLLGGDGLTRWVANGKAILAELGYTYISISIFFSPLVFILSINIDALRGQGLLPVMTAITLMSAFLNIGFDYLFVVEFEWGVAGSAYGTVLAQACSLSTVLAYRFSRRGGPISGIRKIDFRRDYWRTLLALGAPSSLGYIGVSLSAGLTLYCLQLWSGTAYEPTAGAFGIITRLMTFTFLPLLGLSMAFQTIVGNNFGASDWRRSNGAIKLAIAMAAIYCVSLQILFFVFRREIGAIFVDDEAIITQMVRILPLATMLLSVFGPLMMIGSYFQAIGDAGRAAILGLSRTYIFGLPLTFALPFMFGEPGIWYGGIVAEVLMIILTFTVLYLRSSGQRHPWGLFQPVN